MALLNFYFGDYFFTAVYSTRNKTNLYFLSSTLCDPSMSIQSTKELSLYCDIIEMDTSVCMALNRIASSDYASLGTILHTKDCFNVMMSLLNPKIYCKYLLIIKFNILAVKNSGRCCILVMSDSNSPVFNNTLGYKHSWAQYR